MGKGAAAGKAFLDGVLSKITDPELKAAAAKAFADATIQTEVGNGVEGQAEIDRQLQTLRTQTEEAQTRATELDQREAGLNDWHGRLQTWHTENRDALTEYSRLKKDGKLPTGGKKPEGNGNTPAAPPEGTYVTPDQLQETVATANLGFLGYQRDQNKITREHYMKFGEIIDVEPLLHHPKIRDIGLVGVYELTHADRLKKHAEDAQAAAEKKIRDDERAKVLAENQTMPYPTPTGAGSGSPLDALTVGKPDALVDQATAHYARLQAERSGATR